MRSPGARKIGFTYIESTSISSTGTLPNSALQLTGRCPAAESQTVGRTMKYVGVGRVHPERANVHFFPVTWTTAACGSITVQCDASQLTVVIVDIPEVDGYISAYILAESVAQTIVAALGLALGIGY